MQYISQLNFCAPLLPVNLTVNEEPMNFLGAKFWWQISDHSILTSFRLKIFKIGMTRFNCKLTVNDAFYG